MKKLYIIALLLILQFSVKAQFLDSLQIKAGTSVTVASKDYLPLWLVANRFGVISDQQFDFSTHFAATNTNRIGPYITPYDQDDRGWYVTYGVDLYNNDHLKKTIIEEGYLKIRHKKLTLSAGRFKQIIGEVDPDLSSGSLGVSGNALPIPKINLALEYSDVPFTNGWFQFKGMISHGWMGNDQFMKGAYLHEKNFYMRFGKHKFKLYAGIQHYAVWGGSRAGFFTTDRSFKGFLNVLTGIQANDGTVVTNILPNRPGDHRGIIEGGAEWDGDNVKIDLNSQTPFDSGQGIDIRNTDRLVSLNIINKQPDGIWKKFVFEFITTKQMNNFYPERVRESYYNNGIYRTGWEYNDNIVGTPLFVNRVRGSKYFSTIKPHDWDGPLSSIPGGDNIIDNRVVGGNIGAIFAITDQILSKTKITFTDNFGGYKESVFSPHMTQWYTLQEFSWKIPRSQLSLTGSVGYDFGQFSKVFGSMFGLQWQLRE
jgi:hypothetical protein